MHKPALPVLAALLCVLARAEPPMPSTPTMPRATLNREPTTGFDLQAAINEAAALGTQEVVIPAGVHRIGSKLRLRRLSDFTLRGPDPESADGAVLMFTSLENGGISVSDCERLALRGFTIDFDPLPFTQGTIDAIDLEAGTLSYTVHAGYPDVTPDRVSSRAHIFSPQTLDWKPTAPDIYAESARALSARRAELSFSAGQLWQLSALSVGDYIVQDRRHELGALRIEPATDVTVSHITIRSAPGLAMTLRFMGGQNRFDHITIAPGPTPPGATVPRLISTSADGFNYAYARSGPILENCDFSRMGDDSVNLHGIAFAVADSGVDPAAGPYITLIRPYGAERFPSILRPGDAVHALSRINFDLIGRSEIASLDRPQTTTAPDDLALADDIFPIHQPVGKATFYRIYTTTPLSIEPGDLVEIPAIDASGYIIRNNRFAQHRARALRLMSSNGLVENNLIDGIKQAPLTIGPEFVGFREAGWVHDVVIRGNTIRNSGFDPALTRNAAYTPGAISIIHRGDTPAAPLPAIARHRNIVIEQNTIDNVGGPGIHINQAADVTIRDNHLSRTNQVTAPAANLYGLTTAKPIEINNSINVTVDSPR